MVKLYARLKNQYIITYQTPFSARFDKKVENDRTIEEIDFYNNLNINRKLSESGLGIFDCKFQLEQHIQNQESKNSARRYEKINSMTLFLYKTTAFNRLSYVRKLSRSSTLLSIENDDKYCFLMSIVASIQYCTNNQPLRVSI